MQCRNRDADIENRPRLDALRQVLGAGALGKPRGMGWGGRWEGDQGGEHVSIHG